MKLASIFFKANENIFEVYLKDIKTRLNSVLSVDFFYMLMILYQRASKRRQHCFQHEFKQISLFCTRYACTHPEAAASSRRNKNTSKITSKFTLISYFVNTMTLNL